MNPIEILRRARDIITNTGNWCQGVLVRNGPDRAQYCVVGAMSMGESGRTRSNGEQPSYEQRQAISMLDMACWRLFGDELQTFGGNKLGAYTVAANDRLGHSSIMLALDTAIGDYPDHAIHEPSHEERLQGKTITECRIDDPSGVRCPVVFDEVHHATATEIQDSLQHAERQMADMMKIMCKTPIWTVPAWQ